MAKTRSRRSRQTRSTPASASWRPDAFVLGALLLVTGLVFSPVRHFDFVNYDDPYYVTENPAVPDGLTTGSVAWAFSATEDGNWFPLTWLTHMLDVELYGFDAGGHHVTSLLIHLLSTALLFGVMRRMTGAMLPSAFVAVLFGIHPQHVESVAWIAERKDVLYGLFWMLTLWAWVWYADRPGPRRYALALAVFSLGLMSKAMIVTLPAILLLVDVWPLERLAGPNASPARPARPLSSLIIEKLPFLALAVLATVATFLAQSNIGAVSSLATISIGTRVANALVSYVAYVWDMVWPTGLAVFYPHPLSVPLWHALGALGVLGAISWLVYQHRHRRYLVVGWLWYLLSLVPVLGLIQLGSQARADRYMYTASVGLSLMVTWLLSDRWQRRPAERVLLGSGVVVFTLVLTGLTWRQVQTWQNSETLFAHAVSVTRDNYVAHNNLGLALRESGRAAEAVAQYERAIAINPAHTAAYTNLGEILLNLGRPADAVPLLEEAVQRAPGDRSAQVNLGSAFSSLGQLDAAADQFRLVLTRWPETMQAYSGLGIALAAQGKHDEAIAELERALVLDPDYADGHYNLGIVLTTIGRAQEAEPHFRDVVRLQPRSPEARFNLGNALAAQGKLDDAVLAYTGAIELRPDYARAFANLGTALAATGQIDQAITAFERALLLEPGFDEVRQNLEYAKSIR